MSGSAMLRQLHFSCVDIELHHRYQPGGDESATDVRKRVAQTTTILPPLPEDAFVRIRAYLCRGLRRVITVINGLRYSVPMPLLL